MLQLRNLLQSTTEVNAKVLGRKHDYLGEGLPEPFRYPLEIEEGERIMKMMLTSLV